MTGRQFFDESLEQSQVKAEQGVPLFEYTQATRNQQLLFELSRPLDELEGMLLDSFAGRKMTMLEVYEQHHVGKRYIKHNYKDVFSALETKGQITASPPAGARRVRKGIATFGDKVVVAFPAKDEL